ncbi:hypothetical protein [Sphingopyxis macrogoltabida]|uniref:Lipoprotein n=1 Tax=Sphingopyxis macrogoltabida TaxID=33050 RepID=A0AAC9AXW2_SPHMC|nr:hypothetical protein [Sphingopyxis macrogoltabida]ALJ15701.1 hypothetical protein LH19_22740 [Sphingopyxis macrogoltabida]AMU91942.1 hypothetical protein ATM17_23300 [Sphingopyxis macrogoltabida]
MILRASRLPAAALIGAAVLTLTACDGSSPEKQAAAAPAGEAKEQPAASPTPETAAPAAAPPAATPAAGAPDLAAYVGKYPFDKVDSVAFDDHPLVKAGIATTVKDARIRKAIIDTPGPAAPIELIDGKVASWACQQHKCGEHQWMVLVDPKTGATDVCYMNDPEMVDDARWFLANGKEEKRDGDCAAKKG